MTYGTEEKLEHSWTSCSGWTTKRCAFCGIHQRKDGNNGYCPPEMRTKDDWFGTVDVPVKPNIERVVRPIRPKRGKKPRHNT